jgi:hypothetical protein
MAGLYVDCARARARLGRVGACVAAFSLPRAMRVELRISDRDWQNGGTKV